MRKDIIMQMVQPYVKDYAITYDEFDGLFSFLSIKEQYAVTDLLYENGINLVDKRIEAEDLEDDEIQGTEEEFEVLYDDAIFKDTGFSEEDETLTISKAVKLSNEILCELIQQGNRQAQQDLCIKNKRLVDKYVLLYQKRYGNRLDFDDLEQVGYVGLIKAAQRFDMSQESAFSTYAVYWIKQSISREIMDSGYVIRIPVHMMERINKVVALDNSLGNEGYSFKDRIKNISEELELSYEEVKECLILKNNYLTYASLNSPVGEDEESELGEFIPDEEVLQTEDLVMQIILKEQIDEVLDTLSEREKKIIILRFGLKGETAKTLDEIGKLFNVTRERIRQIENKVLKKLRYSYHSKNLKDYLC